MAQLNHFSHDHSLIFHKNVDSIFDDKWYFSSCNACGIMIFSSPSYICSDAKCHFILHKKCAEFPTKLEHHSVHEEDHTLTLVAKAPDGAQSEMNTCGNCKCMAGNNFIYTCKDDSFFIHLSCAFPLDIRVLHPSHMQHELVPHRVEVSLDCGACKNKHQGHFYMCSQICGFWLHWDCASMPTAIKLTNHEEARHMLCLSYASFEGEDFSLPLCGICEKGINVGVGYYFCIKCRYFVHFKCGTIDKKLYHRVSSLDIENDPDIPHLPMMDEHTSVIPSLLKRFGIDETSYTNVNNNQKLFEHLHDHMLTFHHCDEDEGSSLVCDACIEMIYGSYYSCSTCPNFFLHSCCIHLPPKVKCPFVPVLTYHNASHFLSLTKPPMSEMIPQYLCSGCQRYCSGFSYKCETCSYFYLDVVCALLPDSITHKAHKRGHILFLEFWQFALNKCCNNTRIPRRFTWTYRCRVCPDYCMHTTCSMLPMNITHKYDRHKLKLATSSEKKYDPDYHFCEVCEESILGVEQNKSDLWYYNCDLCDTAFHVGCIPSVSPRLSKIKFGGTIKLLCHPCRLTSIRMLTWHSYPCGICKEMLDGLKDNIAFICPKKCGYIVHYECIKKNLCPDDNKFFLEYEEIVTDVRARFDIPGMYEDI